MAFAICSHHRRKLSLCGGSCPENQSEQESVSRLFEQMRREAERNTRGLLRQAFGEKSEASETGRARVALRWPSALYVADL